MDEDYSFGYGMAGCPWVLFASPLLWVESKNSPGPVGALAGGAGRQWYCYGGPSIVLRLWVSFLLCWATRRIGFDIVPDACLVLRTLGTGCLVGLR